MKTYSPIAIFCYSRKDKLENLINSLLINKEAVSTKTYFFVDLNIDDPQITENILEYINKIDGFLDKKIILRDKNFGLKKNIMTGIDYVFETEETIICLEDDLIVDEYFLMYMNTCLSYFKGNKKIWHINGWNYPQWRFQKPKVIVGRLMNSWGWATWKDRWIHNNERSKNLISSLSKKEKSKFNFYNLTNWEQQLIDNQIKKISTWAIFWYQTIFLNNGLTLYPSKSLVFNSGMDGTGTNSGVTRLYNSKLKQQKIIKLPTKIYEDKIQIFYTIVFYSLFNITKRIKYLKNKFSYLKV